MKWYAPDSARKRDGMTLASRPKSSSETARSSRCRSSQGYPETADIPRTGRDAPCRPHRRFRRGHRSRPRNYSIARHPRPKLPSAAHGAGHQNLVIVEQFADGDQSIRAFGERGMAQTFPAKGSIAVSGRPRSAELRDPAWSGRCGRATLPSHFSILRDGGLDDPHRQRALGGAVFPAKTPGSQRRHGRRRATRRGRGQHGGVAPDATNAGMAKTNTASAFIPVTPTTETDCISNGIGIAA